jgi:hypothetical protein
MNAPEELAAAVVRKEKDISRVWLDAVFAAGLGDVREHHEEIQPESRSAVTLRKPIPPWDEDLKAIDQYYRGERNRWDEFWDTVRGKVKHDGKEPDPEAMRSTYSRVALEFRTGRLDGPPIPSPLAERENEKRTRESETAWRNHPWRIYSTNPYEVGAQERERLARLYDGSMMRATG